MAGAAIRGTKVLGGGGLLALLLALGGLAVGAWRLQAGLGAATNLSDTYPWGLWIGFDVMIGVALAAGGFTTTMAVYVLGWREYRPLVRPAVLTAFLGYLLVAVGLFFDIGKPFQIWHPIVNWNAHSMLFEVAWCVMLYLTVLFLEFSPNLLEGLGMRGAARALRSPVVLFPLVVAGIILSFGHQNSLGGLFLLSPGRLPHLWWSPLMNYWFLLSAVAAGLAVVSVETILSHRAFGLTQPRRLLEGVARGTAVALAVYLGAKYADLAARGNLGLLFSSGKAGTLFLVETVLCGAVPMLLLLTPGVRRSVDGLLWTQALVIAGVALNRLNVVFFAQGGAGGGYFPSAAEFALSVGLVALGVFLYRWAVVKLPIVTHEEGA